jgi:hydrogenase large subunit
MMGRLIEISPMVRVEGTLDVRVTLENGTVKDAKIGGVVFRGFELLLLGRDPMDAVVFTSRICGICGASHTYAATLALRGICMGEIPRNAYLLSNTILGVETIMNHLFHFYLLFCPDLPHYSNRRLKKPLRRFLPLEGSSYKRSLRIRRNLIELMGILAGKWPNTLVFQPGGCTNALTKSSISKAEGLLYELREWVEKDLLGTSLECWLENRSTDDLDGWLGEGEAEESDLGLYLRSSKGFEEIGRSQAGLLSYGSYEIGEGKRWLPSGHIDTEGLHPFDPERIEEEITSSYFFDTKNRRPPLNGVSRVDPFKKEAYSWSKAPRYDGKVVEVGPLARWVIANDPLLVDLYRRYGSNLHTRILARVHEALRLIDQIPKWLKGIEPSEPFYESRKPLRDGCGVGLLEAPRGALGHWVRVEGGKIKNYQIITPTAWNLSPRDGKGIPGACEGALIGQRIKKKEDTFEIGLIVRSFDPCLSCNVH